MAATWRARNINWTIFRCSNAYAFLGGNKAFNGSCWSFIWEKNSNFRTFFGIISKHFEFSKDVFLKWCPITGFAKAESISTSGWQSAQYVAFSRLLLVYFGLLEDFKDNLDEKIQNILTGLCSLVPPHFVSLFRKCSSAGPCWWLRLAISILLCMLWDVN